MTLRPVSFALLLALALPLAACGDDGPTKAEFIAEADKLCLGLVNTTNDIAEPQSQEEIAPYLDKVIAAAEDTRTRFTALEAPDDGKDVQRALLSALTGSLDRARDARAAAVSGDQAAFEAAMEDAAEVGQRADPEAKAYGFKVCGSEDELPES